MCRTMAGPVLYLLATLLGLAGLPTTTDAADYYDVSYVWSRSLSGVRDYRNKVAGVLGPAVAKDLKVVTRDSLIGLVYVRHGDSAGATRVAKSHTRLLRARGLDAASPIRSVNWTLVGDAGTRQVAAASNAESELSREYHPDNRGRTARRDGSAQKPDVSHRTLPGNSQPGGGG